MAVRTLLRSLVPTKSMDGDDAAARRESERGATLAEYGLIVSLVVTVSIGAIGALTDGSGSYLEATGDDIGTPRLENELIPNELPPEPDWLPQPPGDGAGPPGDPGLGSPPVLNAPLFNSVSGSCFESETPDTDGSQIIGATCDSSLDQVFVAAGPDANNTIVQFQSEMAENLCISAVGGAASPAVQNTCDGSAAQQWRVERNTAIVLRNVGDPTLCAADTAGRLTIETCDFGPAQQFQ